MKDIYLCACISYMCVCVLICLKVCICIHVCIYLYVYILPYIHIYVYTGLWHLSESSIKAGFREIDSLVPKCKFRNCRHTEETLGPFVSSSVIGHLFSLISLISLLFQLLRREHNI
jgi:hypothetical protein